MKNWRGMFLGAGASYDFGLPLVWDITNEIRDWLTPNKLNDLNEHWKKCGEGRKNQTIEITSKLLTNSELHYEQIIGALEVEIGRTHNNKDLFQDLHHMRSWLVELVSILLIFRQVKNEKYIKNTLDLYYRFQKFLDVDYPFWIFTSNHDLNIEILASHYNITYKTGFYNRGMSIPLIQNEYKNHSRIKFDEFNCDKFHQEPLNFMNNINDRGINLFKIHGALDIFLYDDNKKYLKINFDECTNYRHIISLLREINLLIATIPDFKCTNEIAFFDDQKTLQFLRRSVLTGMHKFEDRASQSIPSEILPLFKRHLGYVDELFVIGYGFGDTHINQTFREWISKSSNKKLIIVNPRITSIPEDFKIYVGQTKIIQESFLEFLARETRTPFTVSERSLIDARKGYRNHVQR
ncbi:MULTISPECIES: hypothetical protein [Thalassospira]|nr:MULTISPECIES: hypothetical protein [Thalassospira]MDG4720030.1 hypothetical protein [Thalassospira sp. FZY0004]